MSVLWETDGALANHPAPAGLAESESWANGEKTERFGGRFGHRNTQQSPMKQPPRQDALRFLKNCLKGGGGGGLSWEVGRSEQGRNQELERRGSGCLEGGGGIWSEEIAGETRRLTRVKWREGCGGESPGKANRQGRLASAKPAQRSTAGLSKQG